MKGRPNNEWLSFRGTRCFLVSNPRGGLHGAAAGADPSGVFAFVPDELGMVLKTPQGQTVFRYMNNGRKTRS